MSTDSASQKPPQSPAESLTRSRTEIAEILGAFARSESPVTAYLESGELLFVTRIRHVDADTGRIVVNYGFSKPANTALFSTKAIMLHGEHDHLHVQFLALSPVEVEFQGQPAIQFGFPEYLLLFRRRAHPRVTIPPQMRMKCIVDCPGFIPFELEVVDISRGGQGTIIHDPGIKLEPGIVLAGCRIKHPLRPPITVDLEIRYSTRTRLADGSLMVRAGCRFIGAPRDVAELVAMFSQDLDQAS